MPIHVWSLTLIVGFWLQFAEFALAEGTLELIGESTVDAQTLTFAEGPAARFSGTANGRTHQQTPLTTFRGYQYVTYFDDERRVCLGRRKLPKGNWEIIQFEDHRFESNDSHNTAVIGICERDGTIHMAFDHHASPLNYRVSKLGAAHNPETTDWTVDLFGPVLHTLGSVKPAERVTYPRFFRTPDGNLMLYYRAVTSGNGDGMIEEYDGEKHDWTPGLGRFIARDIGTYTAGDETSTARCPYINSLSYAGQRLHASWVWRDLFERTHPRNQHDICYIYSDDHGRTWHNSAGELIGRIGDRPVHLNSPGLVVVPIPRGSGLANSNTHYAYPDGSVHIVLRHRAAGTLDGSYHHYWRSATGVWSGKQLSFTGDRPKLVGAKDGSLVLTYTDENQLLLARGTPSTEKDNWTWTAIDLPQHQSCYGDAVLDYDRWQEEGFLSLYIQEEPDRLIRTKTSEPVDGFPAPLRVIDYRLKD
ncbi:MAG: BNR repeat-containing protein [Lacipirellulaceae bacterium]